MIKDTKRLEAKKIGMKRTWHLSRSLAIVGPVMGNDPAEERQWICAIDHIYLSLTDISKEN